MKEDEHYQYKLKGVVVHTGTADFGHYYSLIEVDWDQWVEFNDSHIREFDKKRLGSECFGKSGGEDNNNVNPMMGWGGWGRFRDNSKNAYILVYERMVKDPLAIKGSNDILGVKEGESQLEFTKLANCEPSGKYAEVWRNNYEFMMDHHLYSGGFTELITELIAIALKQSEQHGLEILVKFLTKFLFEVACCSSNSNAATVVN